MAVELSEAHQIAILTALSDAFPGALLRERLWVDCTSQLQAAFNAGYFSRELGTLTNRVPVSVEYIDNAQFRITADGIDRLQELLERRDARQTRRIQAEILAGQSVEGERHHRSNVGLTIAGMVLAVVIALWSAFYTAGKSTVLPILPRQVTKTIASQDFNFRPTDPPCQAPRNRPLLQTLVSGLPSSSIERDGFTYPISTNTVLVETEAGKGAYYNGNPQLLCIRIDRQNVSRIHMLLNMSYWSPSNSGSRGLRQGALVGQLVFVTLEGDQVVFDLKASNNIEEWVGSGSRHPSSVWTGTHLASNQPANIDRQIFTFADPLDLDYVKLIDLSQYSFGDVNPGIVLFGIVVELE